LTIDGEEDDVEEEEDGDGDEKEEVAVGDEGGDISEEDSEMLGRPLAL
jgi:hypothetical protein